jgi:hypothetical protein
MDCKKKMEYLQVKLGKEGSVEMGSLGRVVTGSIT